MRRPPASVAHDLLVRIERAIRRHPLSTLCWYPQCPERGYPYGGDLGRWCDDHVPLRSSSTYGVYGVASTTVDHMRYLLRDYPIDPPVTLEPGTYVVGITPDGERAIVRSRPGSAGTSG